jgi:hypothetical protein
MLLLISWPPNAPASAGLDQQPWYQNTLRLSWQQGSSVSSLDYQSMPQRSLLHRSREHQHYAPSLLKTFPALLEGRKYCLRAIQFAERGAFPGKTHYGLCVYGPWGKECTGYVLTNQVGSYYNPQCNIGCRKSSCECLN